jgi:hypothetical protein
MMITVLGGVMIAVSLGAVAILFQRGYLAKTAVVVVCCLIWTVGITVLSAYPMGGGFSLGCGLFFGLALGAITAAVFVNLNRPRS